MQPRAPMRIDLSGMFPRPPRATLAIMVATGIASVAAMVDSGRFGTATTLITRNLLFIPSHVLDQWAIWTPFTYLFVTRDPSNLLLYEIFGLWMFMAPLERLWGTRRFLYYFFGTGTGAAILTTICAAIFPSTSLRSWPFEGAMVAGEAGFVGWILTNWSSSILFMFVIPIRAPYLLAFAVGVPVLYILTGNWQPYVPPLLAMAIGYLMLDRRGLSLRRAYIHFRAWWHERRLRRRARHLRIVSTDREEKRPRDRYLH